MRREGNIIEEIVERFLPTRRRQEALSRSSGEYPGTGKPAYRCQGLRDGY